MYLLSICLYFANKVLLVLLEEAMKGSRDQLLEFWEPLHVSGIICSAMKVVGL